MAIWRLTAKRNAANGKIKKGQSVTVTTGGANQKPNASQVQKAYNSAPYSVSATEANFIFEKIG